MKKKTAIEFLFVLTGTLFILLCRFPWDPPINKFNLDLSAFWGLNYLFHYDIQAFNNISFHYGPLGFLKYPMPMGNNFIYSLVAEAFLRGMLVFLILWYGRSYNRKNWILYGATATFLCGFLSFDFVAAGVVACSILLEQVTKKRIALSFGLFIAATGLYVKSSIGVITLSMVCTYGLYLIFLEKNWREAVFAGLGYLLASLVIGFLLFGQISGLLGFWGNTAMILGGGLSGAALYPDNNWWLILSAAFIWAVLPFMIRNKQTSLLYLIFALPLFAAWKHGIIREDSAHLQAFYNFLLLFYIFVILVSKNIKPAQLMLVALSLVLFYANMPNLHDYHFRQFSFLMVNENIDLLKNRKKIELEAIEQNKKNLEEIKLNWRVKEIIKDSKVDAYPWEINFIPANGLNWQPRPTIQYFRQNERLDQMNADHFASERAPDFLIWHLTDDLRGHGFASSDKKFLLNEEPLTQASIFSNYDLVLKNKQVLLFKKNIEPNFAAPTLISASAKWDTWIPVPESADGLLRLKIQPTGTFAHKLKSKIYKDEAFYVEYEFDNGQRMSYRLSPSPMRRGIWINPFFAHPEEDNRESLVKQVRLSCSNNAMMQSTIDLEWEFIPLVKTDSSDLPYSGSFKLLGKNDQQDYTLSPLTTFHNDFERREKKEKYNYLTTPKGTGVCIQLDESKKYSPNFRLELSPNHTTDSLLVLAKVQAYQKGKTASALVISVDDKSGNRFYKARRIQRVLTRNETWSQVDIEVVVPKDLLQGGNPILSVYAYYGSNSPVLIDDLAVSVHHIVKDL